MDQQQIDKLRAAGYTDDDIRDYIANQPKASGAPTQTQVETLPEIDVTKPSETLSSAQAAGMPTGPRETSFLSDVATAAAFKGGQFAMENPLATAALGAYGASYIPGVNRLPLISDIRNTRTAVGDIAQRAMNRGGVPQSAPVGSPANPIGGAARPVAPQGPVSTGPVAPQAMAPQAAPQAQPSMLDKTTNMIRQLAANKVFNTMAKGGAMAAAALTPGNVGQDYMVPQVGRMRGMEINPMTGRPWTREQLAAYNANPQQFDLALGAAQMPR